MHPPIARPHRCPPPPTAVAASHHPASSHKHLSPHTATLLLAAAVTTAAAPGPAPSATAHGTCGTAPRPPDAFFAKLTRLHPEDRTWTWNPWDTPPLNGVQDSAQRFTCADFAFVHPGTIASQEQTAALRNVRARGPPAAKKSAEELLAWAVRDLDVPPQAAAVVFLVYNPAPWDKARMTPEMVKVR